MLKVKHYDYSLLKQRMQKFRYSQSTLAKEIPINRGALNQKLNNHNNFTQKEIKRIAELLKISPTKIGSYFFKPIVQKSVQKKGGD